MSEHHHARLLLAILCERWDEAEALNRARPVEPATFVRVCREADVPTWVHALLERNERLELLGPQTVEELARLRSRVQRDNLLLIACAEQAVDLLLAAGVRPVLLKGLDVLYRVYDRFDERTFEDFDLLIPSARLPEALRALQAGGWELPPEPHRTHYIRSSHHVPLWSPGPIKVVLELHWNVVQEMRYRLTGEELVERAVETDWSGRRPLRLEDHDLVAHLLLHHFTHYFDRKLKWTIDLRALTTAPGFRWSVVADRVRAWGAVAACGMSLLHLRKLFPEWFPDEIVEALPVSGWRRLVTRPLRSDHPLELFRGTRSRGVQLFLAAALLERPSLLPRWLLHRRMRDRRRGSNPLDSGPPAE